MTNSFLFNSRNSLFQLPFLRFLLISAILIAGTNATTLHAQFDPVLSIQGILKKTSGEAVEDGNYAITFKLYTSPDVGPAAIWTETQTDVEVTSGIYSTVLGNTTSLENVPFDQIYYLGVTVGSAGASEMKPRIQLTSAPYALSLIGEHNKFPSSGQVIADSIKVTGGLQARAGVPGNNGSNHSGYGFAGNNGQKDSGLFSQPTSGNLLLYVDNNEKAKVMLDSVIVRTDLRLGKGSNITYDGLDDWRLVETDYFENDAEGWKVYNPTNGVQGAWSNGTGVAATVTSFTDDFAGKALVNSSQMQVFKKNFTPPGSSVAGSYTYVKVVFKYYFLNSWDLRAEENGWAAFSKTENCTELSVGWFDHPAYVSFGQNLGNNSGQFGPAANFVNGDQGNSPAQWSDQWKTAEMIGRYPSGPNNTNFWVIFGDANDEAPGTESFGVGMIEIWVK